MSTTAISLTISGLSLIISIIGTIVIPYRQNKGKQKFLKNEMENFKRLMNHDYIIPLDELIESADSETINKFVKNKITKLNYLKTSEINYLTSENQFNIIRLIELVKSYYKLTSEITKMHTFMPSSNAENEKHNKIANRVSNIQKSELKILKEKFHENKEKYISLQRDSLVDNSNDFLKSVQEQINNIH